MRNDIIALTDNGNLPEEYRGMVQRIGEALPAIRRDGANFYKAHSQFMVSTLDVTQITTIRSIKHTLAEIDRTRAALEDAYIKQRRRDVDVREKTAMLAKAANDFDRERLEIDLLEAQNQSTASMLHVQGAIRKLAYLTTQYQSLMAKLGKSELTEADYEADEARYHIMTALKQALCAARARGGIIDEGNQIYIFEMGLPAAEVQAQMLAYFKMESDLIAQGKSPTHEMTMQWLEACADKWQHCAADFARRRGVPLYDAASLHSTSST